MWWREKAVTVAATASKVCRRTKTSIPPSSYRLYASVAAKRAINDASASDLRTASQRHNVSMPPLTRAPRRERASRPSSAPIEPLRVALDDGNFDAGLRIWKEWRDAQRTSSERHRQYDSLIDLVCRSGKLDMIEDVVKFAAPSSLSLLLAARTLLKYKRYEDVLELVRRRLKAEEHDPTSRSRSPQLDAQKLKQLMGTACLAAVRLPGSPSARVIQAICPLGTSVPFTLKSNTQGGARMPFEPPSLNGTSDDENHTLARVYHHLYFAFAVASHTHGSRVSKNKNSVAETLHRFASDESGDRMIEMALQIYEEAQNDWLRISFEDEGDVFTWNVDAWAVVLYELVVKHKLDLAQKAWETYVRHKPTHVAVHIKIWTAMLTAYGTIADWERVGQIWRLIRESHSKLDVYAATKMMHLLFKARQPYEAFLLFDEIKSDFVGRKKVLPEVTVNTLLYGLCVNDRIKEAGRLIAQMSRQEDATLPRPGVNTMNTMLRAYGRHGTVDDLGEVLQQMVSAGLEPDVVTFSTILDSFSRMGLDFPMDALLTLITAAGVRPNTVLMTAIVKKLAHTTNSTTDALHSTLSFLFAMERQGPPPNVVTYTIVADLLGRHCERFDGIQQTVALPAQYAFERADVALRAYEIDVKLFRQHLPAHTLALLLLEGMKEQGVERNRKFYHTVLGLFLHSPTRNASGNALSPALFVALRAQSYDVVGKLLDDMESPYEPNERTLTMMLEALAVIDKYSMREFVANFRRLDKKLQSCAKMHDDGSSAAIGLAALRARIERLSMDGEASPSRLSDYLADVVEKH